MRFKDTVKAHELASIFATTWQRWSNGSRAIRGPMSAMFRIMGWLGWSWTSANTVVDAQGNELNMLAGAPKLLEDLAYKALQRRLISQEVEGCLQNMDGDEVQAIKARGWWQEAAAAAFRSKAIKPKERACLRQALSGCFPTADTLYRWNLVDAPLCLCGMLDSPWHRAWHCSRQEAFREEVEPEGLHKFIKKAGAADHPLLLCGLCAKPVVPEADKRAKEPRTVYRVDGKEVDPFMFKAEDGYAYVDGSANQVRDEDLERSSYAMVQLETKKVVVRMVPSDFPASATVAEQLGFLDMVCHTEGKGLTGVFDCAAVLNNFNGEEKARLAKKKWAGIWRNAYMFNESWPVQLLKVKSHQTKEQQALDPLCAGNDRADQEAKGWMQRNSARNGTSKEVETAKELVTDFLIKTARILARAPSVEDERGRLGYVQREREQTHFLGVVHDFQGMGGGTWQCSM